MTKLKPKVKITPENPLEKADSFYEQENYESALKIYQTLLSGEKRNEEAGILQKKIGLCFYKLEKFDEAEKYFETAFSIFNQIKGELDPETLNIASFLGTVYYNNRNYTQSKNIYEYILSVQRRQFKDNESPLLDAIANLAYTCFRAKDFSNAEKLFEEAIFISDKIPDVPLNDINNYKLFLADSLHKSRQYIKAADKLKRYINSELKNESVDDAFLALLYSRLALNLGYIKDKASESVIYFLKSINFLEKLYPDNHSQICEEKLSLAALYRHKLSDDKKSLTVLFEILEELHKHQAQKSAVYFKTLIEIGEIYNSSKKYSEAIGYLNQALVQKTENSRIPDNWKINFLKEIAITELGLNNKSSAREYLSEANLLSQKHFGPKHGNTLAIIKLLKENFPDSNPTKRINDKTSYEGLLNYNKFVRNELRSDLKKRNVRVFISSTFRDMMMERDYLMKNVFPEIKQLCKQYGVAFTEVDLRWGVTNEDVEQGKVIEICLNEIDNSRPYFIGILGERYGWIPDNKVRSKIERTLENFDWLNQDFSNKLSITEMEIQYGVLRNKKMEGNAFFYLRDKKLTPENPDFVERENSHEFEKLQKLKSLLKEQDKFPVRDFDTIKKLGDLIAFDLQKAIIRDSKLDRQISDIEKSRIQQINHIKGHCEFYIPIEENIKKLDEFILGKNNKAVIFSPPGKGKSALLSYWIKEKYKNKKISPILFHFAGANPEYDHIGALRLVILDELITLFNIKNQVDYDNDNIVAEFEKIFNDKNISSDVVIVIDGIERIKHNPIFARLYWLPLKIPENIKLIIATNSQEYFDILLDRDFLEILPEEMNYVQRKKFIVTYLSGFGKKLPENLIRNLLEDEVSDSPLTLKIILNELRIMGKHEDLESELTKYLSSSDTVELFIKVLERIEDDYDSNFPGLISKALSFLSFSKSGLSEHELIDLTNSTRLHWSPVQNSLEKYFSRANEFITINNTDFLAAVRLKYLSDKNIEKEYKTILANYILKSDDSSRKAAELSELLFELRDSKNLAELITDVFVFNHLIQGGIDDLIKYNNLIKEDFDIAELFKNSIKKAKLSENPNADFLEPLRNIAKFFVWILDLDNALYFAEESYKLGILIFGETHPITAKSILLMADIQIHRENKLKAKNLYLKATAAIEKSQYKNRLDLGLVYNKLAGIYFAENKLEKAKKYALKSREFFETNWGKNSVGISNSLILIGTIELKNENYEEAERYTKEALKILETTLGKNHVTYQSNVISLINIYEQKGDDKRELELLIEQEKVFTPRLGEDHMLTKSVKTRMASIYFGSGDFEKAEQLSKELVETAEKYNQLEEDYALVSKDLLVKINEIRNRKTDWESPAILPI